MTIGLNFHEVECTTVVRSSTHISRSIYYCAICPYCSGIYRVRYMPLLQWGNMELYNALYITNYFITNSIYPTNFIYYVYNKLHIPHYNRGI